MLPTGLLANPEFVGSVCDIDAGEGRQDQRFFVVNYP
jgi:hypothetical protein